MERHFDRRHTSLPVHLLLDVLISLAGIAVVVTTLLPFIRKGYWWVRVWDFPRMQIASVGAAVIAGLLITANPDPFHAALIVVTGVATAYQAYRIFPFMPIAPTQVLGYTEGNPHRRLRVLISNVLVENRRSDRLLEVIARTSPDIVLAMETDDFWARALETVHHDFPFRIERPQDNAYGMVLLSRLELRNPEVRYLMDHDVPSFRTTVVLGSGEEIRLYAVHPRPPLTLQPSFMRDAELLIVGREIRASGDPTIVAGDLNDVAWSYTTRLFQRISGLMDPRLGRGLYNSFHAKKPYMRWPLDHIFFDPDFRLVRLARQRGIGSDHFPMLAELSYEPEGADEHEARSPMPGDRAEARRLIRDGRQAA